MPGSNEVHIMETMHSNANCVGSGLWLPHSEEKGLVLFSSNSHIKKDSHTSHRLFGLGVGCSAAPGESISTLRHLQVQR